MLNIDEYLTGDWNGDSVDDLAIRQDFRIFMDYTHDGIPDLIQEYGRGNNEDEYLVGDWDGDGRDNLAVRRGFEVLMDINFDNEDDLLQNYGTGNNEDEYLVGDWDGDGRDNLAVRRGFEVLMDTNFDNEDDLLQNYGTGNNEDEYLVGDWDGDGRDNLAVRRGFEVLMDTNFDNEDDLLQLYGRDDNQDEYLVGDWDGDGRDNLAVLRGFEVLMDTNFDNEHDFIHTLDLNAGGDTIEEASSVSVASDGKTYAGLVSSDNPNDYFSFSLGTENEFTLSLDSLSADADVQVLDLDGNVVLSGTNAGTTAESISDTLDAGAYRLRVFSADNEETAYNLDLAVTPNIEEIDGITITTTGSDAVFGLDIDDSSQLINLDDFRSGDPNLGSIPEFAGIDGSGFSAVIIDSGIDLDHPFFGEDADNDDVADRIVYHQDFADSDLDATDVNGHGSNVSSIVASEDETFTGMAPGADIISLKVSEDTGDGDWAYTEQALQWVVTNVENFNIASVNMSLGDGQNYNTSQQLYGLGDELAALTAKGVIVVSSAGNHFRTWDSQQGVTYPAADPNSLAVGAVFDAANLPAWRLGPWNGGAQAYTSAPDQIAPWSQRHPTLTDIFAPGPDSTGANATGGTVTMGGTSQAAPHIAGMAVLAQQLAQQELNRQLTPDQFRDLLQETGTDIFDGDENGNGIVDGDEEDDNVANTGLTFQRADMLALAQEIVRPPALGVNEAGDGFGSQAATGDFNEDGFEDLAVAAPYEAPGSDPQSGAVFIYLGTNSGELKPWQVLTQQGIGSNEDGDRFGDALAVGDFDGDGKDDLAVGASREAPPGATQNAGYVFVFQGSNSGLQPWQGLDQQGLGVNEGGTPPFFFDGDYFGTALAAGDFDNDGKDDLAVGAPGEAPGADPESGYVFIFQGNSSGLQPWQGLDQQGLGVNESGDRFGTSLTAGDFDGDSQDDLAVGAPGEAPGADPESGYVFIFQGNSSGLQPWQGLDQQGLGDNEFRDYFGTALAAGDFDNDGKDDLAVGAPGEAPGADPASGYTFVFKGNNTGLQPWQGLSQQGLDTNEHLDAFGSSLTVGDFDADGEDDLVVGTPGESPFSDDPLSSAEFAYAAGSAYVFSGSSNGLQPLQKLDQQGLGSNEAGDAFGAAKAAGDFDGNGNSDLAVGAPGEAPFSDPASGYTFIFQGQNNSLEPWYGLDQEV
ncbi:MAG: FG-GAP repeat protein [Limnoraphis sp. WC205]|nr:FG-GAP repeat protein [Limnoraphis sp. WC205]